VKINFPRHFKAWRAWSYYSSMQFDIQHWIEVSAECEVPVELTPSEPLLVTGSTGVDG